jgi:hypothetical protein
MEIKITEQTTTETKDKLLNLWKSDISREVAKSEQILETKRKWLEDYEQNYGNEKIKPPKGRNRNNLRKNIFSIMRINRKIKGLMQMQCVHIMETD